MEQIRTTSLRSQANINLLPRSTVCSGYTHTHRAKGGGRKIHVLKPRGQRKEKGGVWWRCWRKEKERESKGCLTLLCEADTPNTSISTVQVCTDSCWQKMSFWNLRHANLKGKNWTACGSCYANAHIQMRHMYRLILTRAHTHSHYHTHTHTITHILTHTQQHSEWELKKRTIILIQAR